MPGFIGRSMLDNRYGGGSLTALDDLIRWSLQLRISRTYTPMFILVEYCDEAL